MSIKKNLIVADDPNDQQNGDIGITTEKGTLVGLAYAGPNAAAYAAVFAAAPELLECLSGAVDRMLGSSPAITELRNRSLTAIAKATSAQRSGS